MTRTLCLRFLAISAAAAPPFLGTENGISLWAGTPVVLELNQNLNLEPSSEGNVVRLKVVQDVIVNGKILIRSGVAAYGRVRRIERCSDADCTAFFIVAESVAAVDGQMINLNSIEAECRSFNTRRQKTNYQSPLVNATVLNTRQIQA